MQLSLSVRIAEGFLSKEVPLMTLEQVAEIAQRANFASVCMRASQVGVQSTRDQVKSAHATLAAKDLRVSMVTGNFDIVYNNDRGPQALRGIEPYVELAVRLGAPMVRVALKKAEDISAARHAADVAAKSGIRLVHQCHTLSLFETLASIEQTLRAIDRPNVGLIFEPANLELCGQSYGREAIQRLAPWIFNVYLQNQRLNADGDVILDTWCRGPIRFDIIPIHEPGGIDFDAVVAGLHEVGYDGPLTVHQSAPQGAPAFDAVQATADYLRSLLA